MLQVIRERVRAGRPREIEGKGEAQIHCLHANEPDTALAIGAGRPSLWVSLRAPLQLSLQDGWMELGPRRFHYARGDAAVTATSRRAGSWMALLLPPIEIGDGRQDPATDLDKEPFPILAQPLTPRVWRSAAAIWRAADAAPISNWRGGQLTSSLSGAIIESQRGMGSTLERCPGKSQAQRRQVLNRLLRVRNHVALNDAGPMSVVQMAELAHYSPSHFTRVFEQVFSETPYQYVLDTRMRKAEQLLRRPQLAITEIADQLGFSSGATFARVFKSYFGESATAARSRLTECGRPRRLVSGDNGARAFPTG
jgi:AraC family transcriptional regulator